MPGAEQSTLLNRMVDTRYPPSGGAIALGPGPWRPYPGPLNSSASRGSVGSLLRIQPFMPCLMVAA